MDVYTGGLPARIHKCIDIPGQGYQQKTAACLCSIIASNDLCSRPLSALCRLVLGIRAYFGRANVSRKTLVDNRFLL